MANCRDQQSTRILDLNRTASHFKTIENAIKFSMERCGNGQEKSFLVTPIEQATPRWRGSSSE